MQITNNMPAIQKCNNTHNNSIVNAFLLNTYYSVVICMPNKYASTCIGIVQTEKY